MTTPVPAPTRTPVSPTIRVSALPRNRLLPLLAWATILLISDVPNVIWHGLSQQVPEWIFWGKVGVLGLLLIVCLSWKQLRVLQQFAAIMLLFYLALASSNFIGNLPPWKSRFTGPQVSFTAGYVGLYLRDTGVALAVILALWLMKRDRTTFFLTKGHLDAPIQPVRWLGIKAGESWRTFGWIITGIAALGTLGASAYALPLSLSVIDRAIPLFPAGILFAAINAFNEEIYFRATLLSTLHEAVGTTHALLINAVFFGAAHYLYGSPPGVVGFLMAGFLGWLLGKSMLETKGIGWAWVMHFVMDVIVFAAYAVQWVAR